MKEVRTDFLFADESFITGMASVLDIAGSTPDFNTSNSGKEADYKALMSDWQMVGKDLSQAIDTVKKDIGE